MILERFVARADKFKEQYDRIIAAADRRKLDRAIEDDGSAVQKQFLDKLATSQTQVRALADQLSTTLASITADSQFESGLAWLLDGLEAELARSGVAPS